MDNGGWDVIYAIRTDAVTKNLQANMNKLIVRFAYKGPTQNVGGDGTYVELSGTFGGWEIAHQGAATRVVLGLPIENGQISMIDKDGKTVVNQDISGAVIGVSFALEFLEDSTTKVKNLNFQALNGDSADTNQTVNVISPDITNKVIRHDAEAGLIEAVTKGFHALLWENKAKLDYVFASVSMVPAGESSWMAPNDLNFWFWNAKPGFLIIRTMVGDNTATEEMKMDAPSDQDFLTANPGHDAYVSISTSAFMGKMVKPKLPNTANWGFSNSSPNEFNLSTKLGFTSHWAAGTFHGDVTSATSSLSGSTITTTYSGKAEYGSCSHYWFSGTIKSSFVASGGAKGQFVVTSNSWSTGSDDTCAGDAFLWGFSWGAYYGVCQDQKGSMKDAISGGMASSLSIPAFDVVQWGGKTFKCSSVTLNNALILSGDL